MTQTDARPRDKTGRFIPIVCPECSSGDMVLEDGFWRCNGLADPGDDSKPLEACSYSVEAPIGTRKDQPRESWWCESCSVEVYSFRCSHCGKTRREKR